MKTFLVPIALLSLSTGLVGCSRVIELKDPATGHTFQCKQNASDVMAAIGLAQGANDCAEFHEKLGFVRTD